MKRRNRAAAYTGDFRGVVDKVNSGIGAIAERYLLLHEHFVGEGIEDFGLLVLRRVRFGGVCGTAKRIVFFGTPVACLNGCGEGGGGQGEKGKREEGCEMHSW